MMTAQRLYLVTAAAVALVFGFTATAADAADVFTLHSTTFADGKMMPKKVANSQANMSNPNCVGENVSPQLSWSSAPGGTKSFVLLIADLDGRGGTGNSHWVAYGIPASVTGLAEGEVSKASDKYVGGKNNFGVGTYSGPCPNAGTSPHHYVFTIVATDFETADLAPGLTRDEVFGKLAAPGQPPAHSKGVSNMVGLFVTPWHE
jgi:Raf kinase inhibitor-like YbhB/YbcL family protein